MSDLEFTTVEGLEVAFRARGTGPTLILVHAFPLHQRMWSGQLEGLAEVAHVVTPDLPGFGASQATDGAMSIEALGDWIHAFALTLGHPRFVLGGLSMGGYVALACARRHPEALQGLVLADTRAEADTPAARARRHELIAEIEARGLASLVESLPGHLLAPTTVAHDAPLLHLVREWIAQARPATVCGALEAMAARPDQTAALGVLAVPTLVVVGEADALTTPQDAEEMAARMPDARITRVPGAGHLSALEHPLAFNAAVRNFLASVAAR